MAIDNRTQRAERDKRGLILCKELQGLSRNCAVSRHLSIQRKCLTVHAVSTLWLMSYCTMSLRRLGWDWISWTAYSSFRLNSSPPVPDPVDPWPDFCCWPKDHITLYCLAYKETKKKKKIEVANWALQTELKYLYCCWLKQLQDRWGTCTDLCFL